MTDTPLEHSDTRRVGAVRPRVEIRRSARRRRTVQARMEGDTFVVLMPAGLSAQQEEKHVDQLLTRVQRAESKRRLQQEEDLMGRALSLSRRYLDGRARPTSIRWVTNQRQRWGSCSSATGAIRLSTSMEGMPGWVVDSVIVHELAHLLEANHGPRFKALVHRYDRYAEATAYLRGVAFGMGRPEMDPELGEGSGDDLEE